MKDAVQEFSDVVHDYHGAERKPEPKQGAGSNHGGTKATREHGGRRGEDMLIDKGTDAAAEWA